jgi:hypothetical protein
VAEDMMALRLDPFLGGPYRNWSVDTCKNFASIRRSLCTRFDEGAQLFDLEPGQWISWPQNAPHRVTNLDSVNVSLSTEYFTRATRRRFQLYVANRFFRTRLGCTNLSAREDGALAVAKTLAQRVARRLGLNPLKFRHQAAVLRVVAGAPGGVVELNPAPSLLPSGADHD